MTGLLVGTFAFFGLHTLAWFPRSFREMLRRRKRAAKDEGLISFFFFPLKKLYYSSSYCPQSKQPKMNYLFFHFQNLFI